MIYVLLLFLIRLFLFILKVIKFKSPVLFGTHTLLNRSLRVLKLTTHLSKLATND